MREAKIRRETGSDSTAHRPSRSSPASATSTSQIDDAMVDRTGLEPVTSRV
jgi:hypothetical protein